MLLRTFILSVLFAASVCPLQAASSFPTASHDDGQIIINNRILARVYDKTISVFDLVKKMDLFLSGYYPDVLKTAASRYQFYSTNWKAMLERMIDDQLILADAEGKDFKISEGDIRQAMLDRLGPNVLASLDRLKMTYEEARKMVQEELTVQKMLGAKVHSKAYQAIGPQQIKSAYTEYLAEQNTGDEWEYQVVSIRSPNITLSEQLAAHAYSLLNAALEGPEGLAAKLEEIRKPQDPTFSVTVSQLIVANEKTISDAHRKGLEGLETGMYSQPICQTTGSDKAPVQRIFFLKNHTSKAPPAFATMVNSLRDRLMDTAITQEEKTYKTRLRQRFTYDKLHLEETPTNFQPFSFARPS